MLSFSLHECYSCKNVLYSRVINFTSDPHHWWNIMKIYKNPELKMWLPSSSLSIQFSPLARINILNKYSFIMVTRLPHIIIIIIIIDCKNWKIPSMIKWVVNFLCFSFILLLLYLEVDHWSHVISRLFWICYQMFHTTWNTTSDVYLGNIPWK